MTPQHPYNKPNKERNPLLTHSYKPQTSVNKFHKKDYKKDFKHNDIVDEDRPVCNEEIKAWKVRLIDQNGVNIGVVDTRDALFKAREVSLDLVEVSPEAKPPVCKIMDVGKFIFEKKKKQKENMNRGPEPHEIRLTPSIGQHDLEIKARKAIEFLEEGSIVTIQVKVRGREKSHPELIRDVALRFGKLVAEKGNMENKGDVWVITPKQS